MQQALYAISLIVPDYDAAIAFYCGTLGWDLAEDIAQTTEHGPKRWVRIVPPRSGEAGSSLILAQARSPRQAASIGDQFGGRVGLFLKTDNFERDHAAMRAKGIQFEEDPRHEPYGMVAVWQDPFGNRWDLLELR